MECVFKLVITGVLAFIQPGTQTQIVAGILIVYLMQLTFQCALHCAPHCALSDSLARVSRPYVEKSYHRIAYAAIVQLFVFTVFALLLRYEVAITKKKETDRVLYDVLLGVLTCSVYFIPVVIVVDVASSGVLKKRKMRSTGSRMTKRSFPRSLMKLRRTSHTAHPGKVLNKRLAA